MTYYRIACFTFWCLLTVRLSAQYTPTHLYTAKDGMFVTEVTTVCADRQGCLLIGAYGKGSMRFDGKRFTRVSSIGTAYTTVWDGKQEWIWNPWGSTAYLMAENRETRLIITGKEPLRRFTRRLPIHQKFPVGDFSTHPITGQPIFLSRNYIFYYEAKEQAFLFHDSMPMPPEPGILAIHPDYWGRNHLLFVRDSNHVNRSVYKRVNGKLQPLPMPHDYPMDASWNIEMLPGGTVYLHPSKGVFVRNERGWQSFLASVAEKIKQGVRLNLTTILANQHYLIELVQGDIHYLYDFTPDLKQHRLTVFKFKGKCGNFFQDKAGTYWTASHNGLLRVFPAFTNYFAENSPAMYADIHTVVADMDNKMWFGSYTNGLGYVWKDSVYPTPPALKMYKNMLPGSIRDEAGDLFFSVEDNFVHGLVKVNPKTEQSQVIFNRPTGYILQKDNEGRLLYGTENNGLYIQFDKNCGYDDACWQKIGKKHGFDLKNILGVVQDQHGHYWMGQPSRGFAVYVPAQDTVFNFLIQEGQTRYGGCAFAKDKWGSIWIGTKEGLVRFKPPAKVNAAFEIDRYIQLIAPEVFGKELVCSVYNYKDSLLIILSVSNPGFHILNLNAFYARPQRPYVYTLSPEDGYLGGAGEQNAVCEDPEGKVWFAHDKGISRFDIKKYRFDTVAPDSTIFTSFSAYGDTFMIKNGLVKGLKNKHNSIYITFDSKFNPLFYKNVTFEYQLNNDSTLSTKERSVAFPRLAAGHYTFRLYTLKGGVRSEPVILTFRIPPVWHQNPWFYTGITLLVLSGIGLWYRFRIMQIQQQQRLTAMRVQAIVNQLNPHFINNALNWMQVRADDGNDPEAVAVIDKLANNLRIIFQNSRDKRSFHSLKKEIELVENYFLIQKARFEDRVHYYLPEAALVTQWGDTVYVPLMLLQIHAENAIEHGLNNQIGGGWVKVDIQETANYLVLIVEDNGVGRRVAKQIGSRGTQQGTKMLEELIKIFNAKNTSSIIQYYEDDIFTNASGNHHGTRVIIQMPKIYKYVLSD